MEKKLFIAIKILPSEFMLEIIQNLKSGFENVNIKWVSIENMHITLLFFGKISVDKIFHIKNVIRHITCNFQTFSFNICGLNYFAKNNKIKVIWFGVDNVLILNCLALLLTNGLKTVGFKSGEKKFEPHLTLARANLLLNDSRIIGFTDQYNKSNIQKVDVKEIILFESISKLENSYYQILDVFPLFG